MIVVVSPLKQDEHAVPIVENEFSYQFSSDFVVTTKQFKILRRIFLGLRVENENEILLFCHCFFFCLPHTNEMSFSSSIAVHCVHTAMYRNLMRANLERSRYETTTEMT